MSGRGRLARHSDALFLRLTPGRVILGAMLRPTRAALLFMISLGCGAPAPGPTPGPTPADAAAPAAVVPVPKDSKSGAGPAPGVAEDGTIVSALRWFEGPLDAAMRSARASGRLVLVDVGAYWCHSCHDLDEQIFTLPRVAAAIEAGFVAVKIDAEKDEGPEFAARYKVQAYPTVLVLDPVGIEKGRVVEVADADALLTALAEITAGGDPLAGLRAKVDAAPDDLEARYELAVGLALAARRDEAEVEYAKVLAADPDNAKGFAARVMVDRAGFFAAKLDGDSERAIALYREVQSRFPAAPQAIRAHRSIGRELHRLGRSDEAIAELEKMIAARPDDTALKASYGWFSFRERCRPEAGLKAVEAGLVAAPDDAELHYLRAELAHLTGDDAKALASIRKAAELEPKTAYYRRQVKRFEALAGEGT